jgi:alpha-beta hydrolase superfamily lysophospholipase
MWAKSLKKTLRISRRLIQTILSSLLGALVVMVILLVFTLNNRPDLKVWHTTILDQEFNVDTGLTSFEEYLALEERLFEQLDRLIYQKIEPEDRSAINRYNRGSFSDPGRWPRNWNHSFVFPVSSPKFGVLLLHGLSDSPYSMRSTGQLLHDHSAHVIGMRVPGHGHAPSGLLRIEWQDMAAAVRLAMAELREKVASGPLYIVGYSNGAALAVHYALDTLGNSTLTPVDGLILMSPEIGVTKLAALAKWQERLGHLLGLEKLAWNDLLPEYDPWKYGSFALNAGKQAYLITQEIQKQISSQAAAGTLNRMPPILAFQSAVDATVIAPALVHNLFERLPSIPPVEGDSGQAIHELVIFDINRYADIHPLLKGSPTAWIDPMLNNTDYRFMLTLVSNKEPSNKHMIAASRMPGSAEIEVCDTGMEWPADVYSLSHVALPFPPDDPVYGGRQADPSPGIDLGLLAMRGERDVLQVPASAMLRLRFNPFHSYMEQRILSFLDIEIEAEKSCVTAEAGRNISKN